MPRVPLLIAALAMLAGAARAAGAQKLGSPLSFDRDTVVPVDGIVAIVGNQPILRTDIEERIGTLRAQGTQIPTDSAGQAAMVHEILGQLVDEELLVEEAKKQKITVDDNELTSTVDQQVAKVRGRFASDAEFRQQLKGAGFGSPEEYRRWLMDQQRRQLLQQKLFDKLRQDSKITPAPVTEAEVDSFFQANKGQIPRLPATVTYRQIVVTPKASPMEDSVALAKAESLLVEIRKGADFATLAKRWSMDPSTKEQGGDLGWHRRGEFVPAFDRVYFALRPGEVSPVIKTVFGYHIIKIDRVQPSEVKGRHILIRPQIDSTDIAAARRLADSVVTLWRDGAKYDSLAAKYHDPSEERLMPEPFAQAQLPVEYQQAIKGHKAGDILDPFEILDKARSVPKFFILQLTSIDPAREPSLADYRQRIRDELAQRKGVRNYLDTLRKQTYVAILHAD